MFRGSSVSLLSAALLVAVVANGCEDDTVNVKQPAPVPPALLTCQLWYAASPPISVDEESALSPDNAVRVFWYNIEPDYGATVRDFDPEVSDENDAPVVTMHIDLDVFPQDPSRWAGVMTGFSGSWDGYSGSGGVPGGLDPLDLSEAKIIKFWVNDFKASPADRGGKIYVEFGFIDEDFYRPDLNEYDREDRDGNGFTVGGDHNEDTGLDGVPTGQEGDDPDDDYDSHRIAADGNRFARINGTEGNGRPDDEDLDGDAQLGLLDAYFRYEVSLSDSAVLDVRRDYPTFSDFKNPLDSWRLYEIRLEDYDAVTTAGRVPYRDEIKHMRIWFDDVAAVFNPMVGCVQIRELEFE